jgi:cell division septum initiation protein DivIVA
MPSFPRARQGYARSAVEAYLHDLDGRLSDLTRQTAGQAQEIARLQEALSQAQARCQRLESATLDERGQDILDAAAEQAAARLAGAERAADAVLAQAQREADVLEERARQENAWRHRKLQQERTELEQQKKAVRLQLASFQARAVDAAADPAEVPERALAEVSAGGTSPDTSELTVLGSGSDHHSQHGG